MIDGGKLVKIGGFVAVAEITAQNLQHGGQRGGAHHAGVLTKGIQDGDRSALRVGGRHADFIIGGGGDEGIGHDLRPADGAAEVPNLPLGFLPGGEAAAGGAAHESFRNLIVAVEAGDLLGDVGALLHIGAPGGNRDHIAVKSKTKGEQDLAHLFHGYVGSQQAVDFFGL
ncbi:hypothetical protein SDC9_92928 [bioreactor metagenome]|uniref:Uncharacterized protein n=1 Tax=bioreactor metagenome TaxID=1076179 RepID=A0A644ZZ45_9ZZZZ